MNHDRSLRLALLSSVMALEQAFSTIDIGTDDSIYDADTDTDTDTDPEYIDETYQDPHTVPLGTMWRPPPHVRFECTKNIFWGPVYRTHFTYGGHWWEVKLAWHPDQWSEFFAHLLNTRSYLIESRGTCIVKGDPDPSTVPPDQPKKHLQSNAGEWSPHCIGTSHNPACSVESQSCTQEMSDDVADLCKWHRVRIAKHMLVRCACQEFLACNGDSVGRRMFRDYYDCENIPVIDRGGNFYCCEGCANRDDYTHYCGDLKVCPTHLHLHRKAEPIMETD